jgi:hypothetical protein
MQKQGGVEILLPDLCIFAAKFTTGNPEGRYSYTVALWIFRLIL